MIVRKIGWFLTLATIAGAAVTFAACSSSDATPAVPCNENPWSCGSGKTCWPDNAYAYQCLPAGAATAGEACAPILGTASCGEGLMCLSADGKSGSCLQFCDPTGAAHVCPSGYGCATITLGSATAKAHACVPVNGGTDAGTDTGGGTDAGADADETG